MSVILDVCILVEPTPTNTSANKMWLLSVAVLEITGLVAGVPFITTSLLFAPLNSTQIASFLGSEPVLLSIVKLTVALFC